MNEQGQFDLCPKCGAVARDGICQSCGYEIPGIKDTMEQTKTQQTNNEIYTTPDVYQTQTGQDVYQTPDMSETRHDTGGMFSGDKAEIHHDENAAYRQTTYDAAPNDAGLYGNSQNNGQQYGNGNVPYNGGQYENGNNQYNNGQYGNGSNQYNNGQYGNGSNQYSNGQYGNGNNQYNNGQYGNGNNPYNGGQYGNANIPYNGGQYQYGNNQYGTNPYGTNPYGNNPYSPYATPPAKKHTGLIIGIIITAVILFLVAVFALFYHVLETATRRKEVNDIIDYYDSMDDGDDGYHHNDYHKDIGGNDYDDYQDDYYGYDDDYYDYYDYDDYDFDDYDDDEYYTLHDDIKNNLSYSIQWEYYSYEPDDSDVMILIEYPIVVGSHVPNLDKINEVLADEVSVFTEYYEDEYSNYMYDEDNYFYASATGYVTYMSEDVLSVVFSEMVYSDYYDSVYCYSINIDMRDGVIMDNTDIIAVDDDFSVDFRYRSEKQNGSNSTIDWMSDQEITELLTSPGNLILYYVPQGMEIGFNYEDGWITVTYHDYRDYLKIF